MICKKNLCLLLVILISSFYTYSVRAQNILQDTFNSAKLLMMEGKYSQSTEIFQKLLNNEPENVEVLYYLGLNYQALSNFQKASSVLEKALRLDSGNIQLMTILGNNYYSAGHINDAESVLTEAYLKDSSDSQILLSLGKIYKQIHSWNKAENIYNNLRKQDPENSFYYEQLGFCNVALKDSDNAIVNFQIAHRLNPLNQNTVLELSQLYASRKNMVSAMHIIDDGLKVYPASSILWTKKGDVNLKMKNYSGAILDY